MKPGSVLLLAIPFLLLAALSVVVLREPAPSAAASDPGIQRWVVDAEATAHAEPDGESKVTRVFRIGERVRMSTGKQVGDAYWRELLRPGGGSWGWVRQTSLGLKAPDFQAILAKARDALASRDATLALSEAERAVAMDPRSGEAVELLYAIALALGDARRGARAEQLAVDARLWVAPDDQSLEPLPPAAVAGDVRYCGATTLRLRAKADPNATILTEIPLNRRVDVLAVRGTWAKVRWVEGARRIVRAELDTRDVEELARTVTAQREGWVAWRYLQPAPLALAALREEATTAAAENRLGDATRALERAFLLDPSNESLAQQLARVATATGRYRAAANALPGARAAAPDWVPTVTLVYGCRGDLTKATVFPDESSAVGHPDACLAAFVDTLGSCAPCAPVHWYDDTNEMTVAELEHYESRREAEDKEHEQEMKQWQADQRSLASRIEKLDEQFPNGPFAYVEVTETTGAGPLFAWSTAASEEDFGSVPDDEVPLSMALPAGESGEELRAFVKLPSYAHRISGVFRARDPEAAAAVLNATGSTAPSRGVTVTGPIQSCGCDGC